jgi:dTMP kinase
MEVVMFIAFDGVDGSGKNTQLSLLVSRLLEDGKKVHELNCGGNIIFEPIISKINTKEYNIPPVVRELIYYFEGLYTNINTITKVPKDEFVLVDRYYLSYLAYGVLNGISENNLKAYICNLIEPDIYFYMDIPVDISYERIKKYRSIEASEIGFGNNLDSKNEKEQYIAFQSKVRQGYISNLKDNHIRIDASQDVQEIQRGIYDVVQRLLR